MRIGELVIKNGSSARPSDCIEADGSWHVKEKYPELFEIFKDCKCLKPRPDFLTGIVEKKGDVTNLFHVPNSHGKAWIIFKET